MVDRYSLLSWTRWPPDSTTWQSIKTIQSWSQLLMVYHHSPSPKWYHGEPCLRDRLREPNPEAHCNIEESNWPTKTKKNHRVMVGEWCLVQPTISLVSWPLTICLVYPCDMQVILTSSKCFNETSLNYQLAIINTPLSMIHQPLLMAIPRWLLTTWLSGYQLVPSDDQSLPSELT